MAATVMSRRLTSKLFKPSRFFTVSSTTPSYSASQNLRHFNPHANLFTPYHIPSSQRVPLQHSSIPNVHPSTFTQCPRPTSSDHAFIKPPCTNSTPIFLLMKTPQNPSFSPVPFAKPRYKSTSNSSLHPQNLTQDSGQNPQDQGQNPGPSKKQITWLTVKREIFETLAVLEKVMKTTCSLRNVSAVVGLVYFAFAFRSLKRSLSSPIVDVAFPEALALASTGSAFWIWLMFVLHLTLGPKKFSRAMENQGRSQALALILGWAKNMNDFFLAISAAAWGIISISLYIYWQEFSQNRK